MNKLKTACILPLLGITVLTAQAQSESSGKLKVYGNVTNFATYDSRECFSAVSGIYNIGPKDVDINEIGNDMNDSPTVRFISVATRLGVDWNGFSINGYDLDAKVEADFCSNVNGGAVLRLRDAYFKGGRKWSDSFGASLLLGQTRHPMAKDFPSVLSLSLGAPFNAYNFSPQLTLDGKFTKNVGATLSALWQMQYASTGPDGVSNNYMNYGSVPEMYLGLNLNFGGMKFKLGGDLLSIKPRWKGNYPLTDIQLWVYDRITTFSAMAYAEYSEGLFNFKAKSIFSQAGEHLGLMSGYAVHEIIDNIYRSYTPYQVSSSWVNASYGSRLKVSLFGGYIKNFGTAAEVYNSTYYTYFASDAWNLNRMWRAVPSVSYSMLKDHLMIGLEYELTAAQYGDKISANPLTGLADQNLRWVNNNRIEIVVSCKF